MKKYGAFCLLLLGVGALLYLDIAGVIVEGDTRGLLHGLVDASLVALGYAGRSLKG